MGMTSNEGEWVPAPGCKVAHKFGEEGWRPRDDEAHEHWVPFPRTEWTPMVYLSGATEGLSFDTVEQMRRAARHLLECHNHHFAVLPDAGHTLALSPMASRCVMQAVTSGEWLGE